MRLLITAFGPFPGVPKNPSEALARRIAADRRLKAAGIETSVRIFPTEYAAVARMIPEMIAEASPDAVLMFGVASRRKHLSVEKRGANRASLLHSDASGKKPPLMVLTKDGPAFRRGRAPFGEIAVAGTRAGFRARLSRSAGTYLCNASYYLMLGAASANTPCLFLHIPKIRGRAMQSRLAAAGLAAARVLMRRR
jgi:pyroglutamyl-peptidase